MAVDPDRLAVPRAMCGGKVGEIAHRARPPGWICCSLLEGKTSNMGVRNGTNRST